MYDQLKSNLLETPKIKFRESFQNAWSTFGMNVGSSVGFLLVAIIILLFGFIIIGIIPILGALALMIIGNPTTYSMMNGFHVVARKTKMKQERVFKDFFGGFKTFNKMITLNLLMYALMLPFMVLLMYSIGYFEIISQAISGQPDPNMMLEWAQNLSQLQPTMIITVISFYIFMFLVLSIQSMAMPIIVDTDVSVIEGIKLGWEVVRRNVFKFIMAGITSFILAFVGLLFLGIGILVAVPIIHYFYFHIYDNAFRPNLTSFDDKINEFGTPEIDINTEE